MMPVVRTLLAACLTAWAASLAAAAARAGPPRAAVFDSQIAEGSTENITAEDRDNLARLSEEFRALLEASGRYRIVPTDPVRAQVAEGPDLRRCNGCAEEFARILGADVAITGEVQKVSNLILNINVYVKDLDGGEPERAYSVDIRGANRQSFDRGIKYLVNNKLPPPK